MLGKSAGGDVAHTVFVFAFFQDVDDAAATGFFIAIV